MVVICNHGKGCKQPAKVVYPIRTDEFLCQKCWDKLTKEYKGELI